MNIGLLDFGVGNLKSILQILKRIYVKNMNIFIIKKDLKYLNKIDKLIIPGQGCSQMWLKIFLDIDIDFYILNKCFLNKEILGICVGKHIFFNKTEEFNNFNLNFINGLIKKFNFNQKKYKVPHIGWNKVYILKKHFIFNNLNKINLFYFSHSFYLLSNNNKESFSLSKYKNFINSIFIKDNVCLVQFHPEKSGINGKKIFYNFCFWKK